MAHQLKSLLLILMATAYICWAQTRTCEDVLVNERKPGKDEKHAVVRNHIEAGLDTECLGRKIPVQPNAVQCFKWRQKVTGEIQLKNDTRHGIYDQELVTANPSIQMVTFRSPGFFNEKPQVKHYHNSIFCVYNISISNCSHITIASSVGHHHTLYDDGLGSDYLQLFLGERKPTLTGHRVGSYRDEASTGSFYAVLWSDREPRTSRGTFELTAICTQLK